MTATPIPVTKLESQTRTIGPQASFASGDWKFGSASHNAGSDTPWNNIGNILTENYQYAWVRASLSTEVDTDYAVADGFGFSIPSDACITGIQVAWKGYAYAPRGGSHSQFCMMEKGGVLQGDTRSIVIGSSNSWTVVGGSSDKWGLSWQPSEINANNFGNGLKAILTPLQSAETVYLDCVKISVYYIIDPIPTIDHPDDVSYAGGTTNNSITWHPHDNNPRDYVVTKDGSTVQSGSWTSDSPITVNVDGCSIDPHTYKCAVYDNYSQQASDEVVVNVYSATTVDILNIPSGHELYDSVLIIAKVTGPRASVVYQIDGDGGPQYAMSQVGSTDKYQATWNTNGYDGTHELKVKVLDAWNNELARSYVFPTVLTEYKYELYIEIDYISGYAPTQAVLDYMQNYWKAHGINVTFRVDQNGNGIVDPTPDDGGITPADFWKIENSSNDEWMDDDRAFGNPSNATYESKEKWMLYGSWAAADNGTRIPNLGGGTYGSPLCGNYMFIAEAMIKDWEQQSNIPSNGGEEVVLMHESGHAIGITWVDHHGKEVYDSDLYSVMSSMSLENAKLMAGYWYYSALYWSYADLAYYIPD